MPPWRSRTRLIPWQPRISAALALTDADDFLITGVPPLHLQLLNSAISIIT
jgi:hypothetical protein